MSRARSNKVFVNVYDMTRFNEYMSNIGLGVFHTGVQVHNREYCYGGHQLEGSGIFEMTPKDTSYLGTNYVLRISIEVGETDYTFDDVRLALINMGRDYPGYQYHLLRKNCNHFTETFIRFLCGANLPKWINRLAAMSTKFSFIERSIPKEWLTPAQNPVDNYNQIEQSSSSLYFPQASRTSVNGLQQFSSSTYQSSSSSSGGSYLGIDGTNSASMLDNWRRLLTSRFTRSDAQIPSSVSPLSPSDKLSNVRRT